VGELDRGNALIQTRHHVGRSNSVLGLVYSAKAGVGVAPLPIALGDATKTVPYVMDGRKIYEFTVTWGEERATDDLEGDVTQSSDKRPSEQQICDLLPKYTGVISQVPPQFSAIKISGERAYDLARDGEAVEIPSREVEIFRLTLLSCQDANTAHFEVECGKGTYVRALARDFGRELGCYGHISGLRRSFVAPFAEETMIPLADLVAIEAVEDADEDADDAASGRDVAHARAARSPARGDRECVRWARPFDGHSLARAGAGDDGGG